MLRLNPKSFVGPRAYFTAFDYRILSRSIDHNQLRRDMERKLKLLLLVKSRIVCAASHLTSDFTFDFFREHPELLTTGCIAPALRIDKAEINDLFRDEEDPKNAEKISFYQQNVASVVNWELNENTEWFRDRFVEELGSDRSVVRRALKSLSPQQVEDIAESLKDVDVLSREQIGRIASGLSEQSRSVLLNFRDLLYHVSGARVVNCESSLPQEDYIDYDLADMTQGRAKLSEDQILWKLFIELALESFQRRMLPIELLDTLSFDDVCRLRKPLMEADFQSDYDSLVRSAMITSKNKGQLFDAEELETVRGRLERAFESVFERELPHFLKKRAIGDAKQVGSVATSVALGFAGLIPGVGLASSTLSILKDSPALYMNIAHFHKSMKSLNNVAAYGRMRQQAIHSQIEKMEIGNRTELLDMVDMLTRLISERVKL